MLAQNFKTPTDLGITDAEFDALRQTLKMFELEEVPEHKGGVNTRLGSHRDVEPKFFNMAAFAGVAECGTTACIAGWARWIARDENILLYQQGSQLAALFGMEPAPSATMRATLSEAATAIRNYLTYGEPRWDEVLSA